MKHNARITRNIMSSMATSVGVCIVMLNNPYDVVIVKFEEYFPFVIEHITKRNRNVFDVKEFKDT